MLLPLEGLSQATREVIASVTTQVSAIIVSIHYLILGHLISSYSWVLLALLCDRYKDVCSMNKVHKATWQSIILPRSLCPI